MALADNTRPGQGTWDISVQGGYIWGHADTSVWTYGGQLGYYFTKSLTVNLIGEGGNGGGTTYGIWGAGLQYYLTQTGGVSPYLLVNWLDISGNMSNQGDWQYGIGVDYFMGKTSSIYLQYSGLSGGGETNSVGELGVRFFFGGK